MMNSTHISLLGNGLLQYVRLVEYNDYLRLIKYNNYYNLHLKRY